MIVVKKRNKVKPLILDLKCEVFRLLDKKYITINNIKYLLDKGTLVILVSNTDSSLELFNMVEEINLIIQNQFLMHNGDWWVCLKDDSNIKKDLILNNKYKVLDIEIKESEVSEVLDIKKED